MKIVKLLFFFAVGFLCIGTGNSNDDSSVVHRHHHTNTIEDSSNNNDVTEPFITESNNGGNKEEELPLSSRLFQSARNLLFDSEEGKIEITGNVIVDKNGLRGKYDKLKGGLCVESDVCESLPGEMCACDTHCCNDKCEPRKMCACRQLNATHSTWKPAMIFAPTCIVKANHLFCDPEDANSCSLLQN